MILSIYLRDLYRSRKLCQKKNISNVLISYFFHYLKNLKLKKKFINRIQNLIYKALND